MQFFWPFKNATLASHHQQHLKIERNKIISGNIFHYIHYFLCLETDREYEASPSPLLLDLFIISPAEDCKLSPATQTFLTFFIFYLFLFYFYFFFLLFFLFTFFLCPGKGVPKACFLSQFVKFSCLRIILINILCPV